MAVLKLSAVLLACALVSIQKPSLHAAPSRSHSFRDTQKTVEPFHRCSFPEDAYMGLNGSIIIQHTIIIHKNTLRTQSGNHTHLETCRLNCGA